ncbi:jg21681 [Pararge aegeria aegeria]|uniref:Jg21681 protein n=1 Tax=Pararge aegeria aegeria TaxID=348720 RepID=A0A8S4RBX2_9NEOP|nr:jg21681 [Pararge aegeria aegeria]
MQWSSRTTRSTPWLLSNTPGSTRRPGRPAKFWNELGWLERSSGEPHQWPYVQRTVPDQPSAEKAQEQQTKKKPV